MGRTAVAVVITALLLLCAGCIVPSLQPLYTDETAVAAPGLPGSWADTNNATTYTFTPGEGKAYRLDCTDKEGAKSAFVCHVVTLDGRSFIDMYPVDLEQACPGYAPWHFMPVHSFYLIEQLTPSLRVSTLNPEWLGKYRAEHPGAIGTASLALEGDANMPVFTATTAELQMFLRENVDTPDAYYGAVELTPVVPTAPK